MFSRLITFWNGFIEYLKVKIIKPPIDTSVQEYTDIERYNLLAMATTKISNLTCTEATFEIESDSTQSEPLRDIAEMLEMNLSEIAQTILGFGECYLFPAIDRQGNYFPWIIPIQSMGIVEIEGDRIYEAYAVLEEKKVKYKKYFLVRHHKLQENGTLNITYAVYDENGKPSNTDLWGDLNGTSVNYVGANHIGFARYKSPVSSRGQSRMGVPLNYGTSEIEKDIFKCLDDIREEFKLTKIKLFADKSILVKNQDDSNNEKQKSKYDIPDGIFVISKRAGDTGDLVYEFAPEIRYSSHYQHLINLLEQWENAVGTSKGILSPNEATKGATATEIRRANSDTLALINNLRSVIDSGNIEALKAFNLSLNVPTDLWSYSSDWVNPFEDSAQTFTQIKDAINLKAIKPERMTKWMYPTLTDEEIEAEMAEIQSRAALSADYALESALRE